MSKQLEALLLADDLVEIDGESNLTRMLAAGELRRLHKVNQELLEALKEYVDFDPVDVEMNPIKRQAIAAITKAGKQP